VIRETEVKSASGWAMIGVVLPLLIVLLAWIIYSGVHQNGPGAIVGGLLLIVDALLLGGFFVVNPGEGRVLQLFGAYKGTDRTPGFRWNHPFYSKRRISLRVRNFESAKLKVNDHDGNPIEIAAVVVWKVVDSAEAFFQVDDYVNYVNVQSESALRNMATSYPYDAHETGQLSLRGNTADIAQHIKQEIQERLAQAGVEVIEARISHLAYAPEIAQAMLQRQQASAIIAARTKIVDGAVGMVEMALERLSEKQILRLDEEHRATMVSNLLVVLCGQQAATPLLNTGSLYT
jgi:regulator of protease activity HflC (stomatin/prohibitin superfamily)